MHIFSKLIWNLPVTPHSCCFIFSMTLKPSARLCRYYHLVRTFPTSLHFKASAVTLTLCLRRETLSKSCTRLVPPTASGLLLGVIYISSKFPYSNGSFPSSYKKAQVSCPKTKQPTTTKPSLSTLISLQATASFFSPSFYSQHASYGVSVYSLGFLVF